jgi:hypothetical protein
LCPRNYLNSAGEGKLDVREALLQGFADRYFSDQRGLATLKTKTSSTHAAQVSGHYLMTRRFDFSMASISNLFRQHVLLDAGNGKLLLEASGQSKSYREIEPYLWQQDNGKDQLAVNMTDGKPSLMATSGVAAIVAFQRIPAWQTLPFVQAVMGLSVFVLIITILSWPAAALTRRY